MYTDMCLIKILLAAYLVDGLGAQQLSGVALIYPQHSDVTVDAATDLTLGCRGTEPMIWTFNDAVNGPYFNTSRKKIINIFNDKELIYKHETILTVYNVSGVNVGYYYCHGAAVDIDTPRRSNKIYVFIHDDGNLFINYEEKGFMLNMWRAVIPCRPTSPDINISLRCGFVRMSVNPSNYNVIQEDAHRIVRFNIYDGFTLEHKYSSYTWYLNCTCDFTRDNRSAHLYLRVIQSHILSGKFSIEGPATADAGGDITLRCVFLTNQYFPYDKHWPQWKVPVTGNKQTEILEVVKLKDYLLIINTVTIKNISTEDEGDYRCLLDSRLQILNNIKYVYVNGKKSNHSAPRIYSPTGGEIEINSGANITFRCEGSRPVTWAGPKRQRYQIEHVSNIDGLYKAFLHLTKVDTDPGLYHCHENDSLINHPFKSDKMYLFVKDRGSLYIASGRGYQIADPYANVTVPCLSASRDVNMSLSMLYEAYDYYSSKSSPGQMFTPVVYAYDLRAGITVQLPGFGSVIATCTFSTETARETVNMKYQMTAYDLKREPQITGPDEDLVFAGQTLELSCIVIVFHNLTDDALRWTFPNRLTANQVILNITRINVPGAKVLINKLTIHDVMNENAGRYSCNLTSNNATATKVISVDDTYSAVEPYIQNLTYDYAYIGQPLVLRCRVPVVHNDGLQMSWTTPNGTKIQNLNTEYIPFVRNISGEIVLKIDNTTYENEGNYSCNVLDFTNGKNYTTKHILVKKGEKPRIEASNFKEQEQIVVLLEETVNLTCSAAGDPKPVITWMKDFTEVQRLGEHIGFAADNSELTVNYVQRFDTGLYTCIAENPFGRDYRAVTLQVQTVLIRTGYIEGVIFMIILFIVVSALLIRRTYKNKKLQREFFEAGFIKFKFGELDGLNPYANMAEQAALLSYDTKWEIPRNSIELGRNLGSGYFGLVVEAKVSNFFDGEPEKTVAVKMLHRNCNIIELNSFICELKIMSHLGVHVNLINLLGACTDRIAEGNLFIVIEYCKHGSLSNYLRKNRGDFVNLIDSDTELICFHNEVACRDSGGGVNTLQLLRWALQMARGMEFLAAKQILHGDLALRNVLLDENYVVKISDFGLSKTLSSSGYYKKTSQCPLPIKWMAIESIRDKTFSTQSDVWAFGVVLWELFSLARIPYAELEPDFRFYRKLESGYRLERPEYSTREIYQVMRECWCERPSSRPSFSCLVRTLHDLLQDSKKVNYFNLCEYSVVRTAASDWIALDILPLSDDVDDTTIT